MMCCKLFHSKQIFGKMATRRHLRHCVKFSIDPFKKQKRERHERKVKKGDAICLTEYDCMRNNAFLILKLFQSSNLIFFCFRIFVNRSLHLENIKFYGFDMDYTLAGKMSYEYFNNTN